MINYALFFSTGENTEAATCVLINQRILKNGVVKYNELSSEGRIQTRAMAAPDRKGQIKPKQDLEVTKCTASRILKMPKPDASLKPWPQVPYKLGLP